MTYKRRTVKHDYMVRIIRPSTGVIFTCPHLGGYYVNELTDIGQAEIRLPNTWVKDRETGIQKLVRNQVNQFDILQIFRDSAIVFSGLVLGLKKSLSSIIIKAPSAIWLLTKQVTRKESYTEEPATTLKRFLKGRDYAFKDNFNRTTGIGANWTTYASTYWGITGNQLRSSGVFYNEDAIQLDDARQGIKSAASYSYADYNGAEFEFDLVFSHSADYMHLYILHYSTSKYIVVEVDASSYISVYDNTGAVQTFNHKAFTTTQVYHVKCTILGSSTTQTVTVFLDGVQILSKEFAFTDANFPCYFGLQSRHGTGGVTSNIDVDNFKFSKVKQIIAEGTIGNFGSSKTTSVSYETLFNAIDKRIRLQCASSDELANHWEWKENPVAFVSSSTPCASLDFASRIGTNKDVTLSIEEKNLSEFEAEEDWESFVTDVLALGAGTGAPEKAGQNLYHAYDLDAYDFSNYILEALYQLSEEQTYATLKSLATLWLGKRTKYLENIKVNPIDYEAQGFSVGDGYLLDIPELGIDTSTYYRVMNERRDFSAEGAETITINWKDKQKSFWDAIREELRQGINKQRYDQGAYVAVNIAYEPEDPVATATYARERFFKFNCADYLEVKKATFSVHTDCTNWTLEIDATDRTQELFGAATLSGDKVDTDVTRFVSEVGTEHSIKPYNNHADSHHFNTWGDSIVFAR